MQCAQCLIQKQQESWSRALPNFSLTVYYVESPAVGMALFARLLISGVNGLCSLALPFYSFHPFLVKNGLLNLLYELVAEVRDKGVWLESYKDARKLPRNGMVPSMFSSGKNRTDLTNKKSRNGENVYIEDVVQLDDPISSTDDSDVACGLYFISKTLHLYLYSYVLFAADSIVKPIDFNSLALLSVFRFACLIEHLQIGFIMLVAAIQDKSGSSQRKLSTRNELHENFSDQVTEEIHGLQVGSADLIDENILEAENISEIAFQADERISDVDEKMSDVALEVYLIVNIGAPIIERRFIGSLLIRISSEGLPVILPYITKQILYASPEGFEHLLQYKSIKLADFVEADLGQKAVNLMLGCCVIVLREASKSLSDALIVAIGCWKGKASFSVMVTAIDC
ncbi:hypothetical protein F3Y22_tig00110814pilonHSYRG00106 [Hibiscus syriacus]|uniref:RNA cytosine-C(5)-methyltransferase NSUN2-like PUA domain-containing protein n=1 Tax=Hibiscus syriacus TaxID=106335 RepID=A0A6A2ZQ34_HIBSY|nr:hypothetical protein F3Y22_tig00110814pilonHSYRG00106 [Hibiscus syriacus]